MSRPRAYFSLVSYADSAFAIGGHDGAELNTMERLSRGDGWVARANLPYGNHRCDCDKHAPTMLLLPGSARWLTS